MIFDTNSLYCVCEKYGHIREIYDMIKFRDDLFLTSSRRVKSHSIETLKTIKTFDGKRYSRIESWRRIDCGKENVLKLTKLNDNIIIKLMTVGFELLSYSSGSIVKRIDRSSLFSCLKLHTENFDPNKRNLSGYIIPSKLNHSDMFIKIRDINGSYFTEEDDDQELILYDSERDIILQQSKPITGKRTRILHFSTFMDQETNEEIILQIIQSRENLKKVTRLIFTNSRTGETLLDHILDFDNVVICSVTKDNQHVVLIERKYRNTALNFHIYSFSKTDDQNDEMMPSLCYDYRVSKIYQMISENRRCPKCESFIEKESTIHITCRNCHHEFCWNCLRDWSVHRKRYNRCNRPEGMKLQTERNRKNHKRIEINAMRGIRAESRVIHIEFRNSCFFHLLYWDRTKVCVISIQGNQFYGFGNEMKVLEMTDLEERVQFLLNKVDVGDDRRMLRIKCGCDVISIFRSFILV